MATRARREFAGAASSPAQSGPIRGAAIVLLWADIGSLRRDARLWSRQLGEETWATDWIIFSARYIQSKCHSPVGSWKLQMTIIKLLPPFYCNFGGARKPTRDCKIVPATATTAATTTKTTTTKPAAAASVRSREGASPSWWWWSPSSPIAAHLPVRLPKPTDQIQNLFLSLSRSHSLAYSAAALQFCARLRLQWMESVERGSQHNARQPSDRRPPLSAGSGGHLNGPTSEPAWPRSQPPLSSEGRPSEGDKSNRIERPAGERDNGAKRTDVGQ